MIGRYDISPWKELSIDTYQKPTLILITVPLNVIFNSEEYRAFKQIYGGALITGAKQTYRTYAARTHHFILYTVVFLWYIARWI